MCYQEKTTRKYPVAVKKINKRYICFGYQSDLDQLYAFYCARYKDISYENFLKLGISEFFKKISSIPKDEPLFDIIKSRIMNTSQIKDKAERSYWQKLKKENKIPQLYLSNDEINYELKESVGNGKRIK